MIRNLAISALSQDKVVKGFSPLPWSYQGAFITDAAGQILMASNKSQDELNANAELIVLAVNLLIEGKKE